MRNDAVPETAAPVGLSLVWGRDPMAPVIDDDPVSTGSSTHPAQRDKKRPKPAARGLSLDGWSLKKEREGESRWVVGALRACRLMAGPLIIFHLACRKPESSPRSSRSPLPRLLCSSSHFRSCFLFPTILIHVSSWCLYYFN